MQRFLRSTTLFAVCLGSLLVAVLGGSAQAEDIFVNGGNLAGGDGSSANPFPTITQALVKARVDRPALPSTEMIIIHVAHVAGGYRGTYNTPVPEGFEPLPLILDVPNLELRGETVLTFDASGLPTDFERGTETMLTASPPLMGGTVESTQFLFLMGPTSTVLDGSNVSVDQFVLDGGLPVGALLDADSEAGFGGADIGVDRAQGFAIHNNVLTGTRFGVFARASTGSLQHNLITGGSAGAILKAGNKASPASYIFSQNRSAGNFSVGVLVTGSASLAVLDPALLPIASGTIFDESAATVSGNDLSNNNLAPSFSAGLRCFQDAPRLPAGQSTSHVTVSVTGNRIANNSVGIHVDAGFPRRAYPQVLTGTFQGAFQNNQVVGNALAPALITFTRNEAALDQSLLTEWKYLQQSTFQLTVSDGELNGFLFDNPVTDPFSGTVLNNNLEVNNLSLTGRNIP